MNKGKNTELKAPFPYFGGKSLIAPKIWELLGNPNVYSIIANDSL